MRVISTTVPVPNGYGGTVPRTPHVWPEFLPKKIGLDKSGTVRSDVPLDGQYRQYAGQDPAGKTILIMRTSSWGDALWLTPLARWIAEHGGRVWIACRETFHEAFEGNPHVKRLFPVPCPMSAFEKADYHLHFEGVLEHTRDSITPAVDFIARHAGVELTNHDLSYVLQKAHTHAARRFLEAAGVGDRPVICVHAAASHKLRTYPAPMMREVLRTFGRQGIVSVVVGLGEQGKHPSQFDPSWRLPLVVDACGAFRTMGEAVALMAECGSLLASDSAFVHFAGALGIPTLALMGQFPARIRTSYYPKCVSLEVNASCAPCMIPIGYNCPYEIEGWSPCWQSIPPLVVVEQTVALLKHRGQVGESEHLVRAEAAPSSLTPSAVGGCGSPGQGSSAILPMPKGMTVLILSYNTRDLTRKCLESFLPTLLDDPRVTKVRVVDNGSADGSREMLEEFFGTPKVELCFRGKNNGIYPEWNAAIQGSRGDLVILGSDTECVDENWLNALIDLAIKNPLAGVVAARQVRPEPGGRLRCIWGGTNEGDPKRPHRVGWDDEGIWNVPTKHSWVTHSAVLVRRDMIDDVGLYDERFNVYSGDEEFCRRAVARGWECWYAPESRVLHWQGQSIAAARKRGESQEVLWNADWKLMAEIRKGLKVTVPTNDKILQPSFDPDSVRVVIGVSFYGRPDLTARFMSEIANVAGKFELYVTEDGSPDQFKNLTILTSNAFPHRRFINDTNIGFLKSQNAMMKTAFEGGADIYISANSDVTFPDPEWIKELLKFMFRDRVQVAGVRIRERGQVIQGKIRLPRIDNGGYVTGAVLAISKHVYRDIGGFDEVFGKGYSEDPDYCARAVSAAYQIGICPNTTVNHEASGTFHSTKELTFQKSALIRDNDRIMVTRWGKDTQPKIVLKCTWNLSDEEASGTTGMFYFARFLSQHANLWLYPSQPTIWKHRVQMPDIHLKGFEITRDPSAIVEKIKPDLIVFGWWSAAGNMPAVARKVGAKWAVYTGDVHYVRERSLNAAGWESRMVQELAFYRAADALTVVCENDRRELPADIAAKTFIVPHRQGRPAILPVRHGKKIVGYLSNWEHTPNVVSLRWFLENVWGRVLRIDPEIHLHLFGYDPRRTAEEFTKMPGVHYAGFADTMLDIFSSVDITITPTVVGAGMNGKVVDSINYGRPCVMVERSGKALGLTALVSDDPDVQAKMIARLLRDNDYYREMATAQERELDVSYGYDLFFGGMTNLFSHLGLRIPEVR